MITLRSNTVEARIVRLLLKTYQLTFDELCEYFNLKPSRIMHRLKRLEKRNIVTIEEFPEVTYLRLLTRNFKFIGRNVTQKRALKHKHRRKRSEPDQSGTQESEPSEYDGIMYQ